MLLKSLVSWGTTQNNAVGSDTGNGNISVPASGRTQDEGRGSRTPDGSSDRLSLALSVESSRGTPTLEGADDPTRFESAKAKKTTLLEGIRKFNQKPKAVGLICTMPQCSIFDAFL
jgi:brefeldin A-inhibited guanine nucleotide-exchange protein